MNLCQSTQIEFVIYLLIQWEWNYSAYSHEAQEVIFLTIQNPSLLTGVQNKEHLQTEYSQWGHN